MGVVVVECCCVGCVVVFFDSNIDDVAVVVIGHIPNNRIGIVVDDVGVGVCVCVSMLFYVIIRGIMSDMLLRFVLMLVALYHPLLLFCNIAFFMMMPLYQLLMLYV